MYSDDIDTSSLIPILHARTHADWDVQVRTEQLSTLARHSMYVLLGNAAGSITLAVGLWPVVNRQILVIWLLVMLLFNLVRWFVSRGFRAKTLQVSALQGWERKFVVSVAISGLLWGVAGSLLYLHQQPEYGLFLALVIVSICSATVATLSNHRYAYPLFLVPAITPLTIHLLLDVNITANAVGLVIPFYFSMLYLLSIEIYQTARKSLLKTIDSQHQAMFDYVTGVPNRRAFEVAMDREWNRAMRRESLLSLVIVGIDDFKGCVDTYGSATGDAVLKAVAAHIDKQTRRGADLVAQIGGDEFAIILPDTDNKGAVAIAKNTRVGARLLPERYLVKIPRLSLSLGVASMVPPRGSEWRVLFQQADEAIHRARRRGKEQLESADE